MTHYQFVTEWHLAAPISQVWEALVHSENWPLWWQAVKSVEELEPGTADGVGNVRRFVWKTPLSYKLAFVTEVTEIQAPVKLRATAVGDVVGDGLWELSETEAGTLVRYTWIVRTTPRWMNALAAIARPALEWNHNRIMEQGGLGLANHLGIKLISQSGSSGKG